MGIEVPRIFGGSELSFMSSIIVIEGFRIARIIKFVINPSAKNTY